MADQSITLYGRLFITADIRLLSGLIIGGNDTGLEIGGVDKVCIRNPLTNEPYIPGSSLRGKMRSQLEKRLGLPLNQSVGGVNIHSGLEDYREKDPAKIKYTPIGHVFGVTGDKAKGHPSLLLVRDVRMSDDTRNELSNTKTPLQFAELKTEVAIDRVTSAATPRTLERVPAGAVFSDAELVYSIYSASDFDHLKLVVDGLQLVEDDYLGGAGARGSGKVRFEKLRVTVKSQKNGWQEQEVATGLSSVTDLVTHYNVWSQKAKDLIAAK
jgi:CRISPR-associated protein Csm3